MHILATLIAFIVGVAALGLIAQMVSVYRGKIVAALAGRSVLSCSDANALVVPLAMREHRQLRERSDVRRIAANDALKVWPLAA